MISRGMIDPTLGTDVTIPYTFYPLALPHWMAWALFLGAIGGGIAVANDFDARIAFSRQSPYDALRGARDAVVADPDGIDMELMSQIEERHRRRPPEEQPGSLK